MTIVLVHGNPETDALWGPLVDALGPLPARHRGSLHRAG